MNLVCSYRYSLQRTVGGSASSVTHSCFHCIWLQPSQYSICLLSQPDCSTNNITIEKSNANVQVIQNKKFENVPYIQCYVKYTFLLNRCDGFFSDDRFYESFPHLVPISRRTCQDIQRWEIGSVQMQKALKLKKLTQQGKSITVSL